ncbi:MAG TPA: thiosulfate oxidation carrier complex protein SoxZ [Burkholderiales bacterium]|nr:thiosulfate oxidation carrier complex protein SoxZ [Burkholderiales bacterium]
MGAGRVRMPASAKRGEVIEIRTLVQHPMESGFRLDNTGKEIPRHIVESFECTYNGREIFRAKLHPAVSTNPFFTFYAVAVESGELVFTWRDDQGGMATATSHLDVV